MVARSSAENTVGARQKVFLQHREGNLAKRSLGLVKQYPRSPTNQLVRFHSVDASRRGKKHSHWWPPRRRLR